MVTGAQVVRATLAENWDGNSQTVRVRLAGGAPSAVARVGFAGAALFSPVLAGTQCAVRLVRGTLEVTWIDTTQQTSNPLASFTRGVKAGRSTNQTGVVSGTDTPLGFNQYVRNDFGWQLFAGTTAWSGGTVSKTAGNPTITGSGTSWLSDLNKGNLIEIPGGGGIDYLVVTDIASNTSATVNPAPSFTASGQTGTMSNHAIPILNSGWYCWDCSVAFNCANATGIRQIDVYRNLTRIGKIRRAAGNTTEYMQGSGLTYFSQYDMIQFVAQQTSGANCSLDSLEEYSPTGTIISTAGH